MKAAFGILALYLSIPLAIVATQGVVAHEAARGLAARHAAMEENASRATIARAIPTAVAAR